MTFVRDYIGALILCALFAAAIVLADRALDVLRSI